MNTKRLFLSLFLMAFSAVLGRLQETDGYELLWMKIAEDFIGEVNENAHFITSSDIEK